MNFSEYVLYFDHILNSALIPEPYTDPQMYHYTELNMARHERWMKKGQLLPETTDVIRHLSTPQKWVLITEPWCGDAAHSVPFIFKITQENPLIDLSIQLRDSENSEIENYLTNGSRSIPKLIVRDQVGNDLFVWGARPAECQQLFIDLKGSGMPPAEIKTEIQKWYNADKGYSIQKEIIDLLTQ
jgi:hypothetical protein